MIHTRLTNFIYLLITLLLCVPVFGEQPPEDPYKARPANQTTEFVIGAHEWAPFSSRTSQYHGMVPRIVSEVLHSTGTSVKYRFMHWSDALDGIMFQEFNGAIVWVMDDLMHEDFLISDPIIQYRTALYRRKSTPEPKKIEDLMGLRFGVNPRYVYNQKSYKLIKDKAVIPVQGKTDAINFTRLLNGEIDFYLSPLLTGNPLLKNIFTLEEQEQLTYTTRYFKFPSTRLVINRKEPGSEEFMKLFNSNLKRLHYNGTVDRYIRDYRFSKY